MDSTMLGAMIGAFALGLVLLLGADPIARWNLRSSRGWPNAPKDPSRPPFIWSAGYLRVIGGVLLIVGVVMLVVGLLSR